PVRSPQQWRCRSSLRPTGRALALRDAALPADSRPARRAPRNVLGCKHWFRPARAVPSRRRPAEVDSGISAAGQPARPLLPASGPVKIDVAPYHYLCDGQLTNCMPQPDTTRKLDAQGDKIMQRLVYRNINGQESIVALHSVNTAVGGGGVRWYEFRLDEKRDP